MTKYMFFHKHIAQMRTMNMTGFTLVEIAIVLLIVTLLMAGLVPTISGQVEQSRRSENNKYMNEVRDAIVGYALANKHLPCPDTNNDGTANSPCATTTATGKLPYKDLGMTANDVYGNVLEYGVTGAFADSSTLLLTTPGKIKICTTSTSCTGTTQLTDSAAAVIVSRGGNWTNPSADENENTDGNDKFVSHGITSDFDDQVIWISPNILFNRMVAAGQLP